MCRSACSYHQVGLEVDVQTPIKRAPTLLCVTLHYVLFHVISYELV